MSLGIKKIVILCVGRYGIWVHNMKFNFLKLLKNFNMLVLKKKWHLHIIS